MTLEPHATRAARVLRDTLAADRAMGPPPDEVAIISAMTRAVERRSRRKRARATLLACTAVAAAAAVYWVGRQGPLDRTTQAAPTLTVELNEGAQVLLSGESQERRPSGRALLREGDSVHVDASRILGLDLSTGTHMTLASSGYLRVTELGKSQRFWLREGRFTAVVAPLPTGHRFVVETPDATIEVHGTSFEVVVEDAQPTCLAPSKLTTLIVHEGQVSARHGDETVWLRPGSTWSNQCQKPVVASEAKGGSAVAPPRPQAGAHRARPTPTSQSGPPVARQAETAQVAAPSPAHSRLDEQNDLFAAALSAERRKDYDGALRALDELLAGFPGSPLGEAARTTRLRVVEQRARQAEGTSPASPSPSGPAGVRR